MIFFFLFLCLLYDGLYKDRFIYFYPLLLLIAYFYDNEIEMESGLIFFNINFLVIITLALPYFSCFMENSYATCDIT
jgi:hypothetical protein